MLFIGFRTLWLRAVYEPLNEMCDHFAALSLAVDFKTSWLQLWAANSVRAARVCRSLARSSVLVVCLVFRLAGDMHLTVVCRVLLPPLGRGNAGDKHRLAAYWPDRHLGIIYMVCWNV